MAPTKPPLRPPPRTLNVKDFAEVRAPELESLHAAVSARLDNNFQIRRNKRRRTTGYRSSKARIWKRPRTGGSGPERKEEGPVRVPRRVRRRMELRKDPESGFVASGDGTKRLRTHLWHAKRFTMVKRWGFYLPLGLHGRGRGSRAVLKWLKYGTLVHDDSYCQPVQLEGTEDSILSVLGMVLLPFPSGGSGEMSNSVKYGACFQNSMLYHVGTSFSQFISPVMYMWRPLLNEDNNVNDTLDHVSNGYSTSSGSECRTSSRQLWIWIHAAALKEGISALKHACQKQMQDSGLSVSCNSLEGRIARLEVTGSTALQILQKILHPVSEAGNTNLVLSRCSYSTTCPKSRHQKQFFLEHAEHLPSNAILSLTVSDPRDLSSNGTKTISETTTRSEAHFQEIDTQASNASVSGISTEVQDEIHMPWSEPEISGPFLADNRYLWDFSEKLNPPVPENILCTEKHQRRLNYFYLDHTGGDNKGPKKADRFDQSCPILLLKHANQGNFSNRWSVVLPLSWVKAFWIPLVSRGAHAIGLRERRWIASDSGLPAFPFDFPDCMAYSALMATEATAAKNSAELRPLAVRPSIVPIPPPWYCILSTLRNELNKKGDIQTLNPQTLVSDGIQLVSDIQNSESFTSVQGGVCFSGFIPRTADALSKYLKNFLSGNVNQRPESELCLERVLLHAYKEGVFEEGAIVCAPTLTDLLQWESSSEEHEQIQIPQSLIKTYFTEQESGKWELQLPDKCSSPESYRWPIGFITTGFVRGSKKPVAVAFCETKLLTQLREQQSSRLKQGRPEIFLLVRNMRSAAYRRALATMVLEQKNEDTEFT